MNEYRIKITEGILEKFKEISNANSRFASVIRKLSIHPLSNCKITYKPALGDYYSDCGKDTRNGEDLVVIFNIDHQNSIIEILAIYSKERFKDFLSFNN